MNTEGRFGTPLAVAKETGAPPQMINILLGKGSVPLSNSGNSTPQKSNSSYLSSSQTSYNSMRSEPNYEEMAKALDIPEDDPVNFKNDFLNFGTNLPTVIPSFNQTGRRLFCDT